MFKNKALLVAIGDELVLGLKREENVSWLSRELALRDYDVRALEVIRDDEEVLIALLNYWVSKANLIVISGGLGPTHDDRTRAAIAKFLEVPLVRDDETYDSIIARHSLESKKYLEGCRDKQASIPLGSKAIFNPVGSALGFLARAGKTEILALPGVPMEFKAMAQQYLSGLNKDASIRLALCKIVGWPESELKETLDDLVKKFPNYIMFLPEPNVVTLAIKGPEELTSALLCEIKTVLEDDALPDDVSCLEEAIIALASDLNASLAFAESCTGGMVGESITRIPGASLVFAGSAVCYSNLAKKVILGVPEKILDCFGAVSEECALAMASGAKRIFKADYAVSVTGIAGPLGGSPNKPVGTVCFALSSARGDERAFTRHLNGDRETIRLWSKNIALEAIWRELKRLGQKK